MRPLISVASLEMTGVCLGEIVSVMQRFVCSKHSSLWLQTQQWMLTTATDQSPGSHSEHQA